MKNKMNAELLSSIITLAWPTMLEQFSQTAVQYIDTAMVGSLGAQATAAVGATETVNWLIGGTVSAIGIGFLACISQALGAGKNKFAKAASAQAVGVTLSIGLALTALTVSLSGAIPVWMRADTSIRDMASCYFCILSLPMLFRTASIIFGTLLRAAGDTRTPMRIGMIVNVINILLNFLLIYPTRSISAFHHSFILFGAGLGIKGAAAASAAAYTFGGMAITYRLWRHSEISPKGQSFLPDAAVLKPCLRVAFPNMLQRFATSFGYVTFASMINSLGDISTAAHTIANTVESAFYIPGWGMQAAAATLSGNAWGAKDSKRLRTLPKIILPLEVGLMTVSGGLLFLFAPNLLHLFSRNTLVIGLGTTILRMVAVSEPFYGVPIVLEGIMQGMGKTVPPFVYNVIGMWGARIAGTFVCTQILGYGLVSAWGCMIAHNVLLFLLFMGHYLIADCFEKQKKPPK